MSRHVVGVAGVLLAILGFSPKVGAAVTTIPSAVFGGAVLLMAGMVSASGPRLIFLHTDLNRRTWSSWASRSVSASLPGPRPCKD